MGNSLNILSTCLPQQHPHPGDEDEPDNTSIEQKRNLAPQADSDEDWDKSEEDPRAQTHTKDKISPVKETSPEKSKQEQKSLAKSNSSTQNTAQTIPKKPSLKDEDVNSKKEETEDDDWDEFEDNFDENTHQNENKSSHTPTVQLTSTIPAPSYLEPTDEINNNIDTKPVSAPPKSLNLPKAKKLVQNSNESKSNTKSTTNATTTPTPTADDLDFFSDMTVKYIPPPKLEKSASPAPKTPTMNDSTVRSPVSVQEIAAVKTARLGFEDDSIVDSSTATGGWGDDNELDIDVEESEHNNNNQSPVQKNRNDKKESLQEQRKAQREQKAAVKKTATPRIEAVKAGSFSDFDNDSEDLA